MDQIADVKIIWVWKMQMICWERSIYKRCDASMKNILRLGKVYFEIMRRDIIKQSLSHQSVMDKSY